MGLLHWIDRTRLRSAFAGMVAGALLVAVLLSLGESSHEECINPQRTRDGMDCAGEEYRTVSGPDVGMAFAFGVVAITALCIALYRDEEQD